MADQDNKWVAVVAGILIVFIIYLMIDYYYADPLTRIASTVDATIDNGAEIVAGTAKRIVTASGEVVDVAVDTTGRVIRTTVDATGKIVGTAVDATGEVVATVVDAAGNVVDLTLDTTGAIVGTVVDATGEVVDVTLDAAGNVVDASGRVVMGVAAITGNALATAINATGNALIHTGKAIKIERDPRTGETKVNGKPMTPEMHDALVQTGAIASPMEGNMLNNLDEVRMSENSMDSEQLNIQNSMGSDDESDGNAEVAEADENGDSVEGFYYHYDYPRYCTECSGKGRYSCNNCENCGYCITPDGYGECVAGDSNGPYFREDCVAYEHNSNGYRIYRRSPYRYLMGLPYFRKDGYYHDLRGYPYTKYTRRHGSHLRDNLIKGKRGHGHKHRHVSRHVGRPVRSSYGTAASRRTRDVVGKKK